MLSCDFRSDESVKEAFASQLHKVLWYFFTVSRTYLLVRLSSTDTKDRLLAGL